MYNMNNREKGVQGWEGGGVIWAFHVLCNFSCKSKNILKKKVVKKKQQDINRPKSDLLDHSNT